MSLDPQKVQSYPIAGSHQAILMIHGFTSTPDSFRHLAHRLSKELGWEVRAPLLPGHGLSYEKLDAIKAEKWIEFAETEFEKLRAQFDTIHLIGLSMGGTLCAHLATKYPSNVRSLVLFSPAMYLRNFWDRFMIPLVHFLPDAILKKWLIQKPQGTTNEHLSYQTYSVLAVTEFDRVCKMIKKEFNTDKPCLIFSPVNDLTIHPKSATWFLKHSSNPKSKIVHLENSPHVVFLGKDNDKIDVETENFLKFI